MIVCIGQKLGSSGHKIRTMLAEKRANPCNYHLCINRSTLGIAGAVTALTTFINSPVKTNTREVFEDEGSPVQIIRY